MLNHQFKIYFEDLCEKRLLRRIRTHQNTSTFTLTAQIIFEKPELLFIDCQIQPYKKYFYPVMMKSLLEIVLFSTLFQKTPGYLVVLVNVLLVWDSRIQKTNRSLLSIVEDQLTNQLANIFREYLQTEPVH